MTTKSEVLRLLASGLDYSAVGDRLGIHPGEAYLIATGFPADGSDVPTMNGHKRKGTLAGSTQFLSNPPTHNPTSKKVVEYWMKSRALADTQMQQAASSRDALPGTVDDPDNVREITTVLGRDHNQVKVMMEQLEAIPGRRKGGSVEHQRQRKSIVDLMTIALSKHEATEEEYFGPAVRDALPDGDELAEQALQQEQEGKDTLVALGKLSPHSDEFDELVEQLVLRLRKHVSFEDTVFLRITEAMGEQERVKLGKKFRRAEKVAPTRPHPHAPKEPAAAVKLAGLAAAPMDRARDVAGSRPAKRKGKPT